MAKDPHVTDTLGSVDLFSRLSKKALEKVARQVKTVQHAAGKDIAVQGQTGVGFHLVASGTAEVLVGGSVVRTLGPGEYFGELSLIDGKPRSASVRAVSDVTTYTLVAWEFAPLLDSEPEVSKALLLAMCERLRSAESR
jgi:CRP/FNR family transcriptional regulator, cyclic AMP receptor protein